MIKVRLSRKTFRPPRVLSIIRTLSTQSDSIFSPAEEQNGRKSDFLCIIMSSFLVHPLFNCFFFIDESISAPCRADISPNQQISQLISLRFSKFEALILNFIFQHRSFFAGIHCSLSANDIKAGTNIEVDGAPWRVLGIFLPQFL